MMRTKWLFAAVIGLLELAGCASKQVVQPIDVDAISAVQAEIKRQVGVYLAAAAQIPPTVIINGKETPVSGIRDGFWCGNGSIGFNIVSVKAEFTTTLDDSAGANAAFVLPANIVTVGPSGGYKRDVTNTEILDFNLWPLMDQSAEVLQQKLTNRDIQNAPIAQALLSLRNALVFSATKFDYSKSPPASRPPQPCFTDYDPTKPASDAGDTFKLGLSITNDLSGGVSVKVTILNFSASGESKSTTGNTLTVAFVQQNTKSIQAARDAMDSECKYPVKDQKKCTDATTVFNKALNGGTGTGVGIDFQ